MPAPPNPGPPPPGRDPSDKSVGELFFDVTERTTLIIREEIELAKAEISEKVNKLVQGGAVAAAAGLFGFFAFILLMLAFAWFLNDMFFQDHIWLGFLIEGVLFILIAAAAGFFAYRSFQKGSPPVPEQAIEEAKLTREILEGGDDR